MKKKTGAALALAVTLSMAFAVPAFAAEGTVDSSGGTSSTTITGTIKPTTLTVTVPTTVAFDVDPGATVGTTLDQSTGKAGQFTSPDNFTIVNNSVVDVYAFVSGVSTVTGVSLVDNPSSVAAKEGENLAKIMVGVKDTAPQNFNTATDWLTGNLSDAHYYAFNATNKGKLAAKDASNNSQTDNKATMRVFGQVPSTGWATGDSFTVVPTFTVTVTDPEAVEPTA